MVNNELPARYRRLGESTTLQIHLLGDFRVLYAGHPVVGLRRPRLQSLFAWLVLRAGSPQSRVGLAGRFWPESSQEQAHTNLRKTLLELRRALPDHDRYLCSDRATVEWRSDAPFSLDVMAFEQAATEDIGRAIALYSGDLLPDCYDDWVVGERERLQRIYLSLLKEGVTQAEATGDVRTAIEYAERLRQLEPLREETYRTLIGLYERDGHDAAALRIYHLCASTLDRELGVEPSEATQDAYARLRQRTGQQATVAPPARPSLVGRGTEMAELRWRWSQAEGGAAGAILLVGEPGIGKTRLTEELMEWAAHRGVTVASAVCYAAEGTLSFGPVTDLLRKLPVPPLDPVWLSEVSRLLPEIVQGRPDISAPGLLTEPWERQRLFEALARYLLAHQPLLVVVDDLQWCDSQTLEWLHYVLRYDPGAHVLVVCPLRTEGIGADGNRSILWSDLRRRGRAWEMEIGPLAPAAAETLARRAAPAALDDSALEQLVRESEGNPLFVLEMARTGKEPDGSMSSNVRAVIEGRLDQLSSRASELVGLAATFGRAFTFSVLARATGWSETECVSALDELWRSRIVREQGADSYDFSHDTLREVAYDRLSEAHRRFSHRRVATALQEAHADDLELVAEQLGRHWECGGLPQRAAPLYELAGDAARRLFAHDSALALYQRALGCGEAGDRPRESAQIRLLLKRAEVLQLVGHWTEAEAVCRQALERAKRLGETHLHAGALLRLGDYLRLAGRGTEAQTYLQAARGAFEAMDDGDGACRTIGLLGRVAWDLGDYAHSLQLLQEQLTLCEQLGDERSRGEALGNIGLIHWRRADLAAAERCLTEQSTIARQEQDREQLSRALPNLAIILAVQGRYEETMAILREQMQVARAMGHTRGLTHALSWMGIVHLQRGEFKPALRCLKHQLQLARGMDDKPLAALAMHQIGVMYHQLGDHRRAFAQYAEALPLAGERDDWHLTGAILTSLGSLYADAGDDTPAVACHTTSAHLALSIGDLFGLGPALASLGSTLFVRGCFKEAHILLDRALTSLLPQQYERCEYLQRHAELLFHQQQYEAARCRNDEARRIAAAIGRKDIQLRARLLDVALARILGSMSGSEAVQALEAMLQDALTEAAQAAVHFTIWQLDRTCERSRAISTAAYDRLYKQTPSEEYRSRFRLLTGQSLLPPSRLPNPPAIAVRHALTVEGLLALLDETSLAPV